MKSEERPWRGARRQGEGDNWQGEDSTPDFAALLAFDVDEVLREAARRPLLPAEVLAAARRRNRAGAFLYLQAAARRGVRSEDPATEVLLSAFRRDALRERGVDERLVRGAA